jgi:hypothetical protein
MYVNDFTKIILMFHILYKMNTIREQQKKKARQIQMTGAGIVGATLILGLIGFFVMTRNTNLKRN